MTTSPKARQYIEDAACALPSLTMRELWHSWNDVNPPKNPGDGGLDDMPNYIKAIAVTALACAYVKMDAMRVGAALLEDEMSDLDNDLTFTRCVMDFLITKLAAEGS